MTMAADLRIAADNSRFGIPAAKLSILIGYKEMRRLVNLVGQGNASYILAVGPPDRSRGSRTHGLVNKVLPLADIDDYAYTLAREMTTLAPLSTAAIKRSSKQCSTTLTSSTYRKRRGPPVLELLHRGLPEGRKAFLERRSPQFKGH